MIMRNTAGLVINQITLKLCCSKESILLAISFNAIILPISVFKILRDILRDIWTKKTYLGYVTIVFQCINFEGCSQCRQH